MSGSDPLGATVDPGSSDGLAGVDASDLPYWQTAVQIRQERPIWVVIWLARERRYRAYPKFRPPAGMISANGSTREELLADMDRIEVAANRPRGRSNSHQQSESQDC
jgi:hypothetical protein